MFIVKGSFDNLFRFLRDMRNEDMFGALEPYAMEGVRALQAFTPKDSGRTADSWDYEIDADSRDYVIRWTNHNINKGYNIAILIQYGHGTGGGGYVVGRDYINSAIMPVFDKIADHVWKAVTSA